MELFQMEVSNHVTCMILKLSSVDHIGWAECLLDTTAPVDLVKWAAAFQQFVGLNVEQALQHLHGNHASWNPYKARLAEAALLDIDRFYDRHSFSEQETPCPYSESQLLDLSQAYYSFILD
jgi:hypothetical protein